MRSLPELRPYPRLVHLSHFISSSSLSRVCEEVDGFPRDLLPEVQPKVEEVVSKQVPGLEGTSEDPPGLLDR